MIQLINVKVWTIAVKFHVTIVWHIFKLQMEEEMVSRCEE
jgi:hypothetical protein